MVAWGEDGERKEFKKKKTVLYLPKERNFFETVRNMIEELSEVHGFDLMNYETYGLFFCCVLY